MLMASVGILDLDPQLKLHAASGSTLTFEWSYTDDKATDAARSYNVELFRDEACTDLYVSWLADGKLSSGKGIFTALAGYPVLRYTFSGLDPETTYYARITNLSFANIQTPVVAGTTTQAGPKACLLYTSMSSSQRRPISRQSSMPRSRRTSRIHLSVTVLRK